MSDKAPAIVQNIGSLKLMTQFSTASNYLHLAGSNVDPYSACMTCEAVTRAQYCFRVRIIGFVKRDLVQLV